MKITVYADVLFFTNLIINYILLYVTSLLSNGNGSFVRMGLASAMGALYAVCMFMPSFAPAASVFGKLLLSLAITGIAFGFSPFAAYIKRLGFFYAVSLLCGGVVTAIVSCSNSTNAAVNNGIIYFNTGTSTILIGALITYFVIKLTYGVYRKYATRNYCKMTICKNGHAVRVNVLVDTGNMLFDPLSGGSVIVVEQAAIKGLIPIEKYTDDIFDVARYIEDVRLIPFKTIDTENGLLVGFKPDKIYCSTPLRDNVIIGVSSKKFSTNGEYNALAGPDSFADANNLK
ncbi:MAG: sigma-E processing peptidase SpoIIGA [Clostridia bacterium]|nr:sigma-E processing peptidase SpoIIGA [Clostridia bacterium]